MWVWAKGAKYCILWDYIDKSLIYDRNPKNWIPNVWWANTETLQKLRGTSTDDEWLVEALGGIGRRSGLVFNPEDLEICICKRCEGECKPWNPRTCPLMKKLKLESISQVTQRVAGIDFGGGAPNVLTIFGKHKQYVLVLFSDERQYEGAFGTLAWMKRALKTLQTNVAVADPEERGMCEALELDGYYVISPWELGGGAKKKALVTNAEKWIEKHRVWIPKKFIKFIESISQISRKDGKIIKHNDHGFDTFIYGLSEYDLSYDLLDFWKISGRQISDLWV